jgi:signal transduction histidine kinase
MRAVWTLRGNQVTIRAMKAPRSIGPVLPAIAVAGLGAAALLAADRHPDQSLGGRAVPSLALQLLAGLGAAGAGTYLARRRFAPMAGRLLLATGVAVFLEQLPLPDSGGALLFTAALAAGAMTSALAGAAGLAATTPRQRLVDTLVGCTAIACSALLLGVLATATFDPRATGCFACPHNLLLLHGDARLHDALVRAGLIASAISCGALALLILRRLILRPAVVRSIAAPVAVCGGTVAALGAIGFVDEFGAGQTQVDSPTSALWLAQCGLLATAAAAVGVQAIRARQLRQRVATTVLAALPSPEKLRATLASTLGDPRLSVVFRRAGGGAIDATGHKVPDADPPMAITEVTRQGEVIAELRHTIDLTQRPERVAQAALGAGLALEHAALHAKLQAELADLTASRARIVEVGDAERRRLERNLHDGAQQRLIALSLALQLIPEQDPEIQRARDELQHALENLRAIAHGIHPVSLTEAGLLEALRDLADSSRAPIRIEKAPSRRLPAAVEAAIYRLVLDCVRLTESIDSSAPVIVRVESTAEEVRSQVVLPAIDPSAANLALQYAADRLATLSGGLTTDAAGTDAIVEATVPCGS